MTTLRRALALTLLLTALGVAPVLAQPIPIAPTDILVSTASLTCVNTLNECSVFQYTVPAAYIATFSNPSALVSPWYDGTTSTGQHGPVLWTTGRPLHLRMLGALSGAEAASFTAGISLGGSVASLNLGNLMNASSGGAARPVRVDVWVTPIASSSATPNATNSVWLAARVEYGGFFSTTIATASTVASQGLFNANLGSANQLNVVWRWGQASNANSINFYNRLLKFGE